MHPDDQANFNFDLSKLSWRQFIYNFAQGMMTHLIQGADQDPTFERNNYVMTIRNEYF